MSDTSFIPSAFQWFYDIQASGMGIGFSGKEVVGMEGQSLIVYYSWTGNTASVAQELHAQTGFALERIEEAKPRPFGSIPMAAMGAWFHFKSDIKPLSISLETYDNLFLGIQVWAGNTTPAINAFLKRENFKNKKVWLFMTMADNVPSQKVMDSVRKRIEQKGGVVVETIGFTSKMLATVGAEERANQVLSPEMFREDLAAWLRKSQIIK
ncbi:MAG: hypothetical protein GT601_06825 [Acidaminobacter sp.]|uniref:flavodoxin family protein n=1 Tax=Acidaminobacter sp. TaxID=1872102 RepID=UPI00137DC0FE|nr:hypothetical protein [Acidaminobacter sp.]MZQ97372.1 hypothetical protein [Acidaminobacter sp.]